LFLQQLERLVAAVAREKSANPGHSGKTANSKLLAAIYEIAFRRIPADPTHRRYRLGDTLGPDNTHWFRDKFGNGRFRLFFRYDSRARIIIYTWVNDERTLRTYGAKTDAYAVFSRMLNNGNPPRDWDDLLAASQSAGAIDSLMPGNDDN
jgi:toxin YhaV